MDWMCFCGIGLFGRKNGGCYCSVHFFGILGFVDVWWNGRVGGVVELGRRLRGGRWVWMSTDESIRSVCCH